MKKYIISALIGALCIACNTTKVNSPENEGKAELVRKKVESKDYTIVVNQANPMRGKTIFLTSEYTLTVKNDSAFAYLPYFGVASYAPYGGEGGIKFSELMSDYQVKPTKKQDGWEIKFKVTTGMNLHYQLFISIYNNGSSSLNISSYEKDPISFSGNLSEE